MYAIVDIETTGGHASANGITEIAIILHNGRHIEGKFHTLLNPGVAIPRYISALTGITNEMVYASPRFSEVADMVFNLLKGRIFVAHNVNFDYSFVRHHLKEAGYDLDSRKLCTIRMSRKVFPGFASYGLGKLCRSLQIEITHRHRALGDVLATVEVFEKVLLNDSRGVIEQMIKGKSKEQYLPPNLPDIQVRELPTSPGVYYFHDQKGKIVYVGKATNLQQRVKSHFSNNDSSKRKQEFLRNIYSVSFKECSTELTALILESIEIRRLWPQYNRSQKKYHFEYGLYTFEDQRGYLRLFIERKKQHLTPVYTFNLLHEGQVLLKRMIDEFDLNEALCFLDRSGEIKLKESVDEYNRKVENAIQSLHQQLPTFLVSDSDAPTANYILVERGKFVGMGAFPNEFFPSSVESIKKHITLYPDNDYIRGLVHQFAEKYPEKKIKIFS